MALGRSLVIFDNFINQTEYNTAKTNINNSTVEIPDTYDVTFDDQNLTITLELIDPIERTDWTF